MKAGQVLQKNIVFKELIFVLFSAIFYSLLLSYLRFKAGNFWDHETPNPP